MALEDIECAEELRRLGAAIREARKTLALSQEEFAERCGLHRTYIGQIERGEKNISFVNILRVAKALSVLPSDLFRNSGA